MTRPGLLCWTCHSPGQDMSASRTDAACVSACHLPGGSSSTHAAHPDRPATCTGCHPVTASPADRAGSAHHFVPAPALAVVAPAAGLPGATVTLTGSHLRGAAAVSFNGVWALFARRLRRADHRRRAAARDVGARVGHHARRSGVEPPGLRRDRDAVADRERPAGGLTREQARPDRRPALAHESLRRKGGPDRPAPPHGAWKTVSTALRATNATGAYAWEYPPARRGAYRARAAIARDAGQRGRADRLAQLPGRLGTGRGRRPAGRPRFSPAVSR